MSAARPSASAAARTLLSMLTTDQKGALAEQAIAFEALAHGAGVSRPLGDERYDLIFDLRPELLRVQCKWAVRRGDVVVIVCRTSRRGRTGSITAYVRARTRSMRSPRTVQTTEQLLSAAQGTLGADGRACSCGLRRPGTTRRPEIKLGARFRARSYTGASRRAHSSAGRASRWHAGGRRFEPGWVHLRSPLTGASSFCRPRAIVVVKQVLWRGTSTASGS